MTKVEKKVVELVYEFLREAAASRRVKSPNDFFRGMAEGQEASARRLLLELHLGKFSE